jgi:two-component system NtrC family sensor kinase
MAIANILLVDIALPEFNSQCASHGYVPVMVPDIPSMLDVEVACAVVLINQDLVGDALLADMERLYFLASGVPIGVFITDPEQISDGLRRALDEGTLERVYGHEVASGLAVSRIDRIYLTACLDASVRAYQQSAGDNAMLHREISLRNRVLDHERELNANITGSITSGLVIIDMPGNIFLINEYARKHLRITASDIMGAPFREVFPEKVCRFVDNSLKKINIQWRRHEMKKITIEDTVLEIATYRMNDYDHKPTGMLMLINDITDQENTTVQLFRSEKLATVGTMLSGIAHELRNPLSIISARSQMALKKEDWDRQWAMKNFESIDGQVNRFASIINSLLDFTRYKATKPGQHKVSEILDETLTYVEYQNIFDAIKVEKQYEEGLEVYGDRSRFVQIFLNIILNAADAMAGRGTLRLSAKSEEHSQVLVEIHDTGSGIDAAVKDRIFDPFFTTKEPGKGTGLGLAVAYKIIQESGGELWFVSEPHNTSFFVRLPSGKKKNL